MNNIVYKKIIGVFFMILLYKNFNFLSQTFLQIATGDLNYRWHIRMVVTAGYDPYEGILNVSDANKSTEIRTLKLSYDNKSNNITDLFKDIEKKCTTNISLLCVILSRNYKNEFRKTLIKTANSFNIPNIRIIGRQTALLYGALQNLSNIWERNIEKEQWKYKECKKQEKSSSTVIAKSEDLEALKAKLSPASIKPLIFVCCEGHVMRQKDRTKFKRIFSNFKEVYCISTWEWAIWASAYAKDLANNHGFSWYLSDTIFERNILIVMGNMKIFEIGGLHCIPYEIALDVTVDHADAELKIYEYEKNTQTMIFGTAGIFEVKLIIDINGIYYVKTRCCQSALQTPTNIEQQLQMSYDHLFATFEQATIQDEKHKNLYVIPPKNIGYNPNSNAVGIDFGTTECCAAVIRSGGPDCFVLDLFSNARNMPSYIAYDEANPICGQLAINRMRRSQKCTVFDSKRLLGKVFDEIPIDPIWPFTVVKLEDNSCEIVLETEKGLLTLSPEEICASMLKHIKTEVDKYQNRLLREAVIAIPSAFTEKQQIALKTAAVLAGWETIHYIPEPVAAAFAYFMEMNIPNASKLLLFDFGGGTMDVCVVEVSDRNLKVLSFDGNYYLGGRDFDALLYNHFDGILKHKYAIDVTTTNKKYLLLQKCQDIKHTLSVSESFWLDVSDFESENNDQIYISRAEFETMAAQNITRITNVILSAINKAHLEKNEINYVVQVGGGSRMPMIKKLLAEIFSNSIHKCSEKPDWIVAQGAALYAYCRENEQF